MSSQAGIDAMTAKVKRIAVINQRNALTRRNTLSQHRRILEADMSEEVESKKLRFDEPSIEFYQRAYANPIVPRVMSASARQPKTKFDSKRFRRHLFN